MESDFVLLEVKSTNVCYHEIYTKNQFNGYYRSRRRWKRYIIYNGLKYWFLKRIKGPYYTEFTAG